MSEPEASKRQASRTVATLRKIGLRFTLFGAMLTAGLALGLVGLEGYYLATGGPERLRREVSGELAAQRRASGEQPPAVGGLALVAGLTAGFGLGLWAWRAAAHRAGLSEEEIRLVMGRPRPKVSRRDALLAALLLAAIVVGAIYAARWLAIDRCQDSGGRWDFERSRCEHKP